MILDYGTPGSGVIERTVLDQQGSPYSRVSTWTGSPDNPANYTLHYQSGNLNGISNAEGWGVYSENSFLTGKLLVGDLTKAGQYMEYENGELAIKGKITVTGGNAATKADVDAVQVGGRNLVRKGIIQGYNGAVIQESGTFDGIPKFVNTVSAGGFFGYQYTTAIPAERPAGTWMTLSFKVFVRAFDADNNMEGYVRVTNDDATLSNYNFNSLIPDFRLSENQNRWIEIVHTLLLTKPIIEVFRIYFWRSGVLAGDLDFTAPKLELGNRATDWTPAPEDVDAGIASAETAAKGYADGVATAAETSAKSFATAEAAAAESAAKAFATAEAAAALTAAKGHSDTLKTRVENRLGLAQLEDIDQTLITGNKVRTSLLEVTDIVAAGITAGHVEGLTLNFTQGKIGDWDIEPLRIVDSSKRVALFKFATVRGLIVSETPMDGITPFTPSRVEMVHEIGRASCRERV